MNARKQQKKAKFRGALRFRLRDLKMEEKIYKSYTVPNPNIH